MRIKFKGKANKDYLMINTMTFRLKNGKEMELDRDYTVYKIDKDGNLEMTWGGCCFWNGYDSVYLTDDDRDELDELISVNIEDDVPDADYDVTIEWWD